MRGNFTRNRVEKQKLWNSMIFWFTLGSAKLKKKKITLNVGHFKWDEAADGMCGNSFMTAGFGNSLWRKCLGSAASASQQTRGDVLLLGFTSHCLMTSTEEPHPPIHPPTPPPFLPQREYSMICVRKSTPCHPKGKRHKSFSLAL